MIKGNKMKIKTKRVTIEIDKGESVSGIISGVEKSEAGKATGIILAHGAGNDMNNPLLVYVCEGLAREGYTAMRFNFLYKEKGRKAPDHAKKLILTWQKVFQFFRDDSVAEFERIIVGGKSMGGRIASQMVADKQLSGDGVILLGYPLHPPGKKDKLRDEHLYRIEVPMLFFAGTRDPLCDLDLLKNVLKKISIPWEIEVIEGGDHSFNLLKSMGIDQKEVYEKFLRRLIGWLNLEL